MTRYPLRPRPLMVRRMVDTAELEKLNDPRLAEAAMTIHRREMEHALGEALVKQCGIATQIARYDLPGGKVVQLELMVEAVPADEALRFNWRAETMHSDRWYVRWLSATADWLWRLALKLEHRSIERAWTP